jgi:tetratricopeptide (TPR) repeat protein/predicted Ser/Thr protein kinase
VKRAATIEREIRYAERVNTLDEPTRTNGASSTEASRSVGVLAGRYRVLALLGVGGMGSVYLADDLELGERVAVKMLRCEHSRDVEFIERLRSEVRLARRVTHKNVARTYDIGEHQGERFLTMEYVAGESLGARIARDGALSLASFVRIAKDVTAALGAAHAAGVVHRDLKPQNILIADDGRASITDFGTAWSSDALPEELVVGTPSYMAPEQFEGHFDERSDIFALGVVFHIMLTGNKPFAAEPGERPLRAPNPADHRPGIPVPLGALVERCLAPNPEGRFRTAGAVEAELDSLATLLFDESAAETITTSPAAGLLRGIALEPRAILIRGVGPEPANPLMRGLREELAKNINEHGLLYAFEDPEREHEASACVEVRRDGEKLVVDVGLLGGREGFEFWRASFDGTRANALALARAAARGIEEALAVDVPTGARLQPLGIEATRLYLAGRVAYQEFWPDSLQRAVTSFQGGLQHLPNDPLLLSALASARARQCFFSEGFMGEARETSELAVRLAPDLPEAHVARAIVLSQDGEPVEAVRALLCAVELAPGQVEALSGLGRILVEAGAPSDGVRLCEVAYARDRADIHLVSISRAAALLGQADRALSVLERIRGPMRITVGLAMRTRYAAWRHDTRAAKAVLDELEKLGVNSETANYDLMFLLLNAVVEGRSPGRADLGVKDALPSPEASRARRSFVHQVYAEAAAYVGDSGNAVASIEAAVEAGLFDALWLGRCPLFDDLLGSARFEAARQIVDARARDILALFHARSPGI